MVAPLCKVANIKHRKKSLSNLRQALFFAPVPKGGDLTEGGKEKVQPNNVLHRKIDKRQTIKS